MGWLIALAVFIAIIAGWWAWKKANEPIPGVDILEPKVVMPVAAVDAGRPPEVAALEVIDAGEAAPIDAGGVEGAGLAAAPEVIVDAGAPTVIAAVVAEVPVNITCSPNVELLLEGKSLGRTPWSGKLPPGRRVFTLQNKALGISTTRAITLKADAVEESYTFEKGFVTVKAPEGAAVFIDGNRIGTAPIKGEIPVYEGSHRIQVTVGQSKWAEPFTLYSAQRVSFNVEIQYREASHSPTPLPRGERERREKGQPSLRCLISVS